MPNDEQEQNRMDLHHHVCRLAVSGALFRAPVRLESPSRSRILDLGTGTGIWAIDMADEYPTADVIGIDLSPIQPGWLPPNCSFEVNDCESSWDYSQPFTFIHARSLGGSVWDYATLFERSLKNLENGGWIEFVDFAIDFFSDDNTLEKVPRLVEWQRMLNQASVKFGKQLNIAEDCRQWMIDAGFKDVRQEVYKVPINPWPQDPKLKELGRYHQVNMVESMESYSLALFTRVLGWDPEEVQVFLAGVRKELVDRSIHAYTNYGRKMDE